MTTLEKIVLEIEKTAATANKELDDLPPAVRPAWGQAIAEAKGKLKELENTYRQTVAKNALGIFVDGPQAKVKEFSAVVQAQGEGIVLDASALYQRLADAVFATLPEDKGVEWGVAQTHRLHLGLQEIMHEVGISELPMPTRNQEPPFVTTREDVVACVKSFIREAAGDVLNRAYLQLALGNAARIIRYTGNVLPVIVESTEPAEASGLGFLFGRGVATVAVAEDDVVDPAFMVKTFKDVNKKLSPRQQPAKNTEKGKE
jgi:hypothetical protein